MPPINAVLALIVAGVLLWLISTYVPMRSTAKSIIKIVAVIAVVLWLLSGLGIFSGSGRNKAASGEAGSREASAPPWRHDCPTRNRGFRAFDCHPWR
jgi:hypothetical protein